MTASEIAADMRAFTGAGVISAAELARYLGYKATWRVAEKYLRDDEDSAVPVIRAVGGKKYIIKEVAVRIKESMK